MSYVNIFKSEDVECYIYICDKSDLMCEVIFIN